jgi:hypothetical protein
MARAHSTAVAYMSRTTELYSLRSETYAKSKAPWTDRSGNARGGLSSVWQASISDSGRRFEIDVFHKVPYGIWLEIRYNGKWSIINRTIATQGPKFMETANQVFAKMFGGVSE